MNNKNKNKKLKNIFLIGLVVFVAIAISLITKGVPNKRAEITKSEATDNGLIIQKSELTDQAKFYLYEVNGVKMEVLAFKASDDTIRTALNTCQVCYDSKRGYYVQNANMLVCQNCGNQFDADQVELIKGGCNPVPITKENKVEDEVTITINEEFLIQNTELFKNWKK